MGKRRTDAQVLWGLQVDAEWAELVAQRLDELGVSLASVIRQGVAEVLDLPPHPAEGERRTRRRRTPAAPVPGHRVTWAVRLDREWAHAAYQRLDELGVSLASVTRRGVAEVLDLPPHPPDRRRRVQRPRPHT